MVLEISRDKSSAHADFACSEIGESKRRSHVSRDDEDLARLGKRPVLKRNFGFVSMLSFCCIVMTTWEGVLALLAVQLFNGGLGGSVYGYLFVWVGIAASFVSMSELASMAPTAAGHYHWVAILSPKKSKAFLSYIVAWLTMVGWQAIVASSQFVGAGLIQALVSMNDPDYSPKAWQTVLLYWAVLAITLIINTIVSRVLPQIEILILILHIFGFIAVMFTVIYFAPHTSASDVFTTFFNDGGWQTQGLSFFVGLSGPAFILLGPDSPVHMSEEVTNPSRNVPRAILGGIALNGTLGFAILIASLFCISDPTKIIASPSGLPFITLFQQAVGTTGGTIALSAIILILDIAGAISYVTTASRLTWSFARDRGIPFSEQLKTIEPRTLIPLNAIGVTVVISICLSLIVLGSSIAFNDVISLSVSGLYTSYLIGNSLLLWRRIRGDIKPYRPANRDLRNTGDSKSLEWGSFSVPEPLGTIINIGGCIFLSIALFFSFWPAYISPTPAQMNYSILMYGATILLSSSYYFVRGHKHFDGPVIETRPDGLS